uniref:Integrase_H2C2 domain-containing protein n=1 Tax=Schistocephalus solidus TaxID=70667 RepID=A0A183TDY1_SCHSO
LAPLQPVNAAFDEIYNRQLHGSREIPEKSTSARALWAHWTRIWLDNGSLFLVGGTDDPLRVVMPRTKLHDNINDIHRQLRHAGQPKTEATVCKRFW